MAPEQFFGKSRASGMEGLSPFEQMYRERVESLQSRLETLSAEQKEYLRFSLQRRIGFSKLSAERYKGGGVVEYCVGRLVPKIKEKRKQQTDSAQQRLDDYGAETQRLKQERFGNFSDEQKDMIEQLADGIKREIEYDWIGMMEKRQKVPDNYVENTLSRLCDSLE